MSLDDEYKCYLVRFETQFENIEEANIAEDLTANLSLIKENYLFATLKTIPWELCSDIKKLERLRELENIMFELMVLVKEYESLRSNQ
jgi:hypothetical protein